MASDIDPNIIVVGQRVSKTDLKEQLRIARDEITDLQRVTRLAYQIAFGFRSV